MGAGQDHKYLPKTKPPPPPPLPTGTGINSTTDLLAPYKSILETHSIDSITRQFWNSLAGIVDGLVGIKLGRYCR